MNETQLELLAEILNAALKLDGEDRQRHIERAVEGNAELRREIWSLIGGKASPGGGLPVERASAGGSQVSAETPQTAKDNTATLDDRIPARQPDNEAGSRDVATSAELPVRQTVSPPGLALDASHPKRVGPFEIVGLLGEGGMGVVFLADQLEPVRRRVALKLVQAQLGSRDAELRFAAERQAMARLSHPNIAQMYEAGTTDKGTCYFAMEHVPGVSLISYCDAAYLSVEERLRIFIAVCEGVRHAHQKGILHRDLKPSNILVSEVEGRATPKIIDFGIAKALDQPLTEETLHTRFGVIGTPAYMSPEALQRSDEGFDLDTRIDVYSLGVILFELLTGSRPRDIRGLSLSQIVAQTLTGEHTPSLCTQISTLEPEERENVATLRQLDAATLERRLKGDLEWIVARAVACDREERYGSVAEFSADIERHLRNEPVHARPPSLAYQTGRFVRRHRTGVAATLLLVLALIGGVVGTSRGLVKAREEAETARKALGETKEVSAFLIDLFEVSDPWQTGVSEITVLDLLERGSEKLLSGLEDQPLARARFMQTVGDVYRRLAHYEKAETFHSTALSLREQHLPEASLEIAHSLYGLASDLSETGQSEKAEAVFKRSLEIFEASLGPEDPLIADVLTDYSGLVRDLGRYDESMQMEGRILKIRENAFGPNHLKIAASLGNLGHIAFRQGRYNDARDLAQQAAGIYETEEPDHPDLGSVLNLLCIINKNQRNLEEADQYCQRALLVRENALGPDHPQVANTLNNWGSVCTLRKEFEQAEQMYQRALGIRLEALGPNHRYVASSFNNLANLAFARERYDEAQTYFERSLAIRVETLGPDHPSTGMAVHNLGAVAMARGKYGDAQKLYERALDIRGSALGPDHPNVAWDLHGLAESLREQGRYEQAEPMYVRALKIRKETLGIDHPLYREVLNNYRILLREVGRGDEAEAMGARSQQ